MGEGKGLDVGAVLGGFAEASAIRQMQLLGSIATRDAEIKRLQAQVDQLQQRGSDLVKERQARLEHDADRQKLVESLRADNDSLRIALGWAHEAKDGLRELADARKAWAEDLQTKLELVVVERDGYRRGKDAAYEERNRLVVLVAKMALALGWRAGRGQHEDVADNVNACDPEWRTLVVVETPAQQASWHFHDSQARLVDGLPKLDVRWDGHDTPTKYARLESLVLVATPPLHRAPSPGTWQVVSSSSVPRSEVES